MAREYGVDDMPSLVYFENKIPTLYQGDLANEDQVLAWLVDQLTADMIEDVTDEMLDKLIKKSKNLAVLFCKSSSNGARNSTALARRRVARRQQNTASLRAK